MSIKIKLIVILVLICSISLLLAGLLLWNSLNVKRKIRIANSELDELYNLSKARSYIYKQMNEANAFLVHSNQREKEEFYNYGGEAKNYLNKWLNIIEKQMELRIKEKEGDLETFSIIERSYNEAVRLALTAFELAEEQKPKEAYSILESDVDKWLDEVLYVEINKTMSSKIDAVDKLYDELLVSLGSMPWIADNGKNEVRNARAEIENFVGIDKIQSNIHRNIEGLTDLAIFFEMSNEKDYDEFEVLLNQYLNQLTNNFQTEKKDIAQFIKYDQNTLTNLENKYDMALQILSSLNTSLYAETDKTIQLVVNELEQYLSDELLPIINSSIDEKRQEILRTHNKLLKLTVSAGLQATFILALGSLIIMHISLRLIKGMVNSLNKLNIGTKIIGRGKLDHRIDLSSHDELGQLALSFNKMTEALQLSREEIISAKEYNDKVIRSMSDSLIVTTLDGIIETINYITCKMLGYGEEEELIGQQIEKIVVIDIKELESLQQKSFLKGVERTYITKEGVEIPVLCSSSVMRDGGRIHGIIHLAQDITERKEIEEAKKKEFLLREIHHRVKNNLQVITTLLDIQSKNLNDEHALEIFNESRNRIRSIAFIHEKLYQSKNPETIDFAEYTRDLTSHLFRSFGANGIKLKINLKDIYLGIDTAIPCGLIINELVSNSLKYAFVPDIEGEIFIDFQTDWNNSFVLTVKDNGVGLPVDVDFHSTESFGLKIVRTLAVHQLKGTVNLNRKDGTEYNIIFKEKTRRKNS